MEGPGPVVGEDDDPELGLRVTEDCDVTSPEGPHPGHQGRQVGRVAGFTVYITEDKINTQVSHFNSPNFTFL